MDVERALRSHLETSGVLASYGHVVVACSGGSDSTALLHLLAACRGDAGPSRLTVAHLDHALRPASAEDARFVERLCARLGIPCVTDRRPIGPHAGAGPEAAAREVRYAFLEETARTAHAGAVVTAHHLDDQAETVLARILRGTGVEGLAGMRPVRRLGGDRDGVAVDLVRPLLPFRAAALRDHLRRLGEDWREDETNRDGNLRARLRATVLPVLAEAAGRDPVPLLARLAENSASAAQALRAVAGIAERFVRSGPAGVLVLTGFARLPAAVQVQVLRAPLARLLGDRGPPSRAEIDRLVARVVDGRADLVAGLRARRTVDGVRIERLDGDDDREPIPDVPLEVDGPGAALPGGTVVARRATASNAAFLERIRRADGSLELLDAGALVPPLAVRSRREGDRFTPLGAEREVRLTHYLQRRGVPAEWRDRVPLVCDARGIVWVAGHAIADRVRVRGTTEELVVLSLG